MRSLFGCLSFCMLLILEAACAHKSKPAVATTFQNDHDDRFSSKTRLPSLFLSNKKSQKMIMGCDGRIRMPVWFPVVDYAAALCVSAKGHSVTISAGQNLISYEELLTGNLSKQVYYALEEVVVKPGKTGLVWAVCGGIGDPLPNGARVVPGMSLPLEQAEKIEQIFWFIRRELKRITKLKKKPNADQTQLDEAESDLKSYLRLFRVAIIESNGSALR